MVEEQADSVTAEKPASTVSVAHFSAADFSVADVVHSAGADRRRNKPWFDTATRQIFFVYSRL